MHVPGRPEEGAIGSPRLVKRNAMDGSRRPSQIYRRSEAPPESSSDGRLADRALIAVFLCAITLPLIGMVAGLDAKHTLEENRWLASPPEVRWSWGSLAQFPARAEAYFNDHFGFRTRLIQWLNYAKVAGLGVSPTPRVILGENGWLYYGAVELPYYRALTPLTEAELRSWQALLEDRRDWLAARGIKYLVVFAPNKSTIYPENMPRAYNRLDRLSRLDQLIAHLRSHTTLSVVDLRPALLEAKRREQVYYRTDTHWNNRGAYVGYAAIMESLSRWYPGLKPLPRSAFPDSHRKEPGRDLALLLNLRQY
jgi:alginate O-acetyltransferase complex protein AlgJ